MEWYLIVDIIWFYKAESLAVFDTFLFLSFYHQFSEDFLFTYLSILSTLHLHSCYPSPICHYI